MKSIRSSRLPLLAAVSFLAVICGGAAALPGTCGPFTDVAADGFCGFVLEIFTLGITTGTSPTTYDPTSSVSRLQMAAFLSRSVDGVAKRNSRRAALRQFWTPQSIRVMPATSLGSGPRFCRSDGTDIWVSVPFSDAVSHLRGTDGKLLDTWSGATRATGILVAMGRVFADGFEPATSNGPGNLYRIDPTQPAGTVTTVSTALGTLPDGIAYDGSHIWTANNGFTNLSVPSSVSIVTPGAAIPWTVTNVTTGFNSLAGILYDGGNIWVTDTVANTLLKLDSAGAVLQTVTVGVNPVFPVFDGTNIWVPNIGSSSISVVRASSGAVIQTLSGNGVITPETVAFDGQRVLVTNFLPDTVSLWKAADLTPLGSFSVSTTTNLDFRPYGACSDGANFWITLFARNQMLRF